MNLSDITPTLEHLKDHAHVKKLILSHNKLDSTLSLGNWSFLMALDLSYNKINKISNRTVGPLTHLKHLDLSYNNISVILSNALDGLTVLEILDLSGNPSLGAKSDMLKSVLAGPLFRSLKKFTMESSNISVFPIDVFEDALELRYLDLSNNNISVIPILPENLVYCNVNNNSVKMIDILSFQKSVSIKDLFIENNLYLRDIAADSFESMYDLRNLSLKGSKSLERLSAHVFYFNKKLRYLSLADSGLTSLPHSFKSAFLEIPTLQLQGNPWVCNISIKWFVLLESSNDQNLRCMEPGNFSFIEYYGPNIRHNVLRNILFGLLFFVFILFGLAIYLSFSMEKKRREDMPYVPLGGKNPFSNRVYVTTVV